MQGQQLFFHPLLQQRPPQCYPLFQLPQLPLVLTFCADLDLALVSIEQLQLLLELLPEGLKLCFLGLIKPEPVDSNYTCRNLSPRYTCTLLEVFTEAL